MRINEIANLSKAFVDAIEETKYDFPAKDRMRGFPRGCCDDVSDLFANFLFEKYGEYSIRVDGAFYADNPEYNDWHMMLYNKNCQQILKDFDIIITSLRIGENNMARNQRSYDSEYKAQAVKQMGWIKKRHITERKSNCTINFIIKKAREL